MERLTGDSIDISEWTEFEFYDLVRFWDTRDNENCSNLGRWLGVSHHIGSALCYWILTDTGKVLSRTTVQHLTQAEVRDPEIQESIRQFHMKLDAAIGEGQYEYDDEITDFVNDDVDVTVSNDLEEPPYLGLEPLSDMDMFVDNSDSRLTADTYDQYVGAEVALPDRKGQTLLAKVLRKVTSADSNKPANYNPLRDHSLYEVEFGDDHTEELSANIIAENMLANTDNDGHHFSLLNKIVDHKKDASAIPIINGCITSKSGNKTPKRTTRGWSLLVEWKDGSVDWVPLVELKESFPVQTAEYALANGIEEEPAFKWWARKVLRHRDRIISKLKSKYWHTSHKFGIRIPKTVDEAYRIDQQTGTDYWTKAIEKKRRTTLE